MDFFGVEGEVDGRAFAYLALGPCAASVPFHDLPDASEADARAGELASRVQPLEWLEKFAHVEGVKARPVVAHVAADGGIPRRRRTELNQRIGPVRGELPGILHQVLQDRTDESGICSDLD
jgi:hypothetical protein